MSVYFRVRPYTFEKAIKLSDKTDTPTIFRTLSQKTVYFVYLIVLLHQKLHHFVPNRLAIFEALNLTLVKSIRSNMNDCPFDVFQFALRKVSSCFSSSNKVLTLTGKTWKKITEIQNTGPSLSAFSDLVKIGIYFGSKKLTIIHIGI